MTDYGIALLLIVSLSFVPASFIPILVGERVRQEKQVQIVSGVPKLSYWIATVIWDFTVSYIFAQSVSIKLDNP